jgi:tricorn protease
MQIRSLLIALLLVSPVWGQSNKGYYRSPAIHGDTVVFTSEGDLWEVGLAGGLARRLTTHPGSETNASFSPDGSTIAFSADYEGPTEVYTMPATGGLPQRHTFDGVGASVVGWTPDGKLIYSTSRYSSLPNAQLVTLDAKNHLEVVPLSQASQGVFDDKGETLFFTRLPFQGSEAKRYKGGTAQNLWKYVPGQEAIPLTSDYSGISKNAMYWKGRVYFASDRDGTMNLWSMNDAGKDLKQLTKHQGWDIHDPSLGGGRVVYQLGANLRVFDITSGTDKEIPIELPSDFDHLREHWIKNPIEFTSAAHVSPDGSSVALTSRGRVFVAPVKQGRLVDVSEHKPGRYRDARFFPDGKSLLVLSSESGEVELWKVPANGVGKEEQLTTGAKALRWEGIPSPDGKWIAHQDKNNQLLLFDTATKTEKRIGLAITTGNSNPQFSDVAWAPDSRWLTFSTDGDNDFARIQLYSLDTGATTPITTDRYNSGSAVWSADGKWLYFLSDRSLHSLVQSPWGSRQPDPYFNKTFKIYELALKKGQRSPFEPPDELHPDKPDDAAKPADAPKPDSAKPADAKPADTKADAAKTDAKPAVPKVEIDLDGIQARLQEVPAPPGNYGRLQASDKRLCWLNYDPEKPNGANAECMDIANKGDKPDVLMDEVLDMELSADRKKLMLRKKNDVFVVDSSAKGDSLKNPKSLADSQVDLKNWTFSVIPSEELREAFYDAWRLHRDYFYAPNMHGVNWNLMRDKYGELVGRVRDREELSDLIASLVSELSVLHTFVVGGDIRKGPDQIQIAALGAYLVRDDAAGGYLVKHVYRANPDRPDLQGPLAKPGVDVVEGDVLLAINGNDLLSVTDPGELLRNQAGKQVLIKLRPKGKTETRDVVVKPVDMNQERQLRYDEWEYTRRLEVERSSAGTIGYVHLKAMGSNDINQWVEDFGPVFNRQGLIIDVRHNQGGNIDSWILGKLLRKAWMYWQPHVGRPSWNMQEAFRGHIVVLCDEWTASDGEAFSEGFRRLGLGKIIGTRTWGGEVWLSFSNDLADRGIASAAELGVYGPERQWLIEGHGVDPDITVDNLPHATFEGKDAQLQAAVAHLQQLIKEKPVKDVPPPPYPDKSFKSTR